jgi:hypothetical protein
MKGNRLIDDEEQLDHRRDLESTIGFENKYIKYLIKIIINIEICYK